MIYGIGTDIVQLSRMEALWHRHGLRLAQRVLSQSELAVLPAEQPWRFIAKRFAVKEAFAKAAGTGLRHPVTLSNLSLAHDHLGRPEFQCAHALQNWLDSQGISRVHVSLSDEQEMVVAFVIMEGAG